MPSQTFRDNRKRFQAALLILIGLGALCTSVGSAEETQSKLPAVGDTARDFELKGLDDKSVKLTKLLRKGPVVLMVLRGYPGYQCPICSRQVGQYLTAAKKFQAAEATVVMIYPGPSKQLKARAKQFITGKTLPGNYHLLIDPDYTFTEDWNLRWDAPRETAYPSTFVIDKDQKIQFAKISKSHGGRAPVADVLRALSKLDMSEAEESIR